MKVEWNKVTWYSKIIALILFVSLPFIGFYFGTVYQQATAINNVSNTSGIKGKVLLGPTCPVEISNNPCPDKAYSGLEIKIKNSSGRVLKTVVSAADGSFSTDLPAGKYELEYQTIIPPKMTVNKEVIIESSKASNVNIQLDSGIR